MIKKKAFNFHCFYLLLTVLLLISFQSYSQSRTTQKPSRVLFILDASGSMNGKWKDGTKIDMAKIILQHLADSLKRENIPFALRVFGHQKDRSLVECNDTKLEVAFSPNASAQLPAVLKRIQPKGYSPIALSLEEAIKDFPITKSDQRSVIILISDGFENCSGDACDAGIKLQKAGIYLRPYIVGLGLTEEHKKQFECVGELFDVQESTANVREMITEVVITSIMNPTSLQINLLNSNDRPTETNVNMSFSNTRNGSVKYNFYHTLNAFGQPDTLYLDPSVKYNLKVHTIPPKTLNGIELIQGKHTIKALETPQGILKLSMTGNTKAKNIKCIVKQNGQILNIQDLNSSVSYITGTYDLEVLTKPVTYYNQIDILQSQTKTINISNPGIVQINKPAGYLFIFKKGSDGENDKVHSSELNATKETVLLQPGTYELVFRNKNANNSKSTVTKKISVVSGIATTVSF